MASKSDVLNELARQGFVFNEVSEIFDEGDIASGKLYSESGVEDYGQEMGACLDAESIEIVSILDSETVEFAALSAEEAVAKISGIMDRFYRKLA